MRLTRYTDYALRVLLYLGARPERLCSISEIAGAYGISQNHLMKVVNDLGRAGYLSSVRGRTGGLRLSRAPVEINVGAVIRHTEDGFDLVDCGSCVIAPACGLTGALGQALAAFMAVLDGYSLEDLLSKRADMLALFPLPDPGRSGAARSAPRRGVLKDA
ncbi:Rrf2 family transcriptional regulator [Brevundimonas lenta]|uniref:Rrf2 family nitric oxide-sensitive transcriptional repressor n=1 Tax=Brevundimonas lenta TaxID=424796 RepID=A0A7W6JC41_9CAUL|nr:Rrf2 family transcriptional regulator [Brevundimonas lenta]MBB4081462.1 Rrf2 family nitric oxide-sensitive transcriptional repressor [Brevundimonas lenta]